MKISCLCITEDREEFLPWLRWNYEKQSYSHKELVVVDSSLEPRKELLPDDVVYIHVPHRSRVATKRNLALEVCSGDLITWMDDDDWQHPDKCRLIVENMNRETLVVATRYAHFVDLFKLTCTPFPSSLPLFTSLGVRRDFARQFKFPEDKIKASDFPWLTSLHRASVGRIQFLHRKDMVFWLCHSDNISNPSRVHQHRKDVSKLVTTIGPELWEETYEQIIALQQRLTHSSSKVIASSFSSPQHKPSVQAKTKVESAQSSCGFSLANTWSELVERWDNKAKSFGPLIASSEVASKNCEIEKQTNHWWDFFVHCFRRASLSSESSILDFGCGSGRFTHRFLSHGFNVTSVDISSQMIDFARKAEPNAHFVLLESPGHLPFRDQSYDFLFSCGVLEEIPEPLFQATVQELRRVIKPNGYILLCEKVGAKVCQRNPREYIRAFPGIRVMGTLRTNDCNSIVLFGQRTF